MVIKRGTGGSFRKKVFPGLKKKEAIQQKGKRRPRKTRARGNAAHRGRGGKEKGFYLATGKDRAEA